VTVQPRTAGLLALDDALQTLLAAVEPLTHSEPLPTLQADGRVLAQDVVSALQVPAHDNSAMDGYAVHAADTVLPGKALPVVQRIPAGVHAAQLAPLLPGTVARIFTGAPVPPGADAVVMQEDCALQAATTPGDPDTVSVQRTAVAEQHIRRAGEDVRQGTVVLARGQRLGPAELGLAASVGMAQLQIVRRPRVALFSTGDELVMPGAVPPDKMPSGAIYNSNRFVLHSLLLRLGCEVTDLGIVPDQRDATVQALQAAAAQNDLILTSGGVSVGEEDHVKPAVQQLGELQLWQLAIKPGKPFAYGRIGAAHFAGLPGNPVASLVTFVMLVRPLLLRLQGVRDVAPKRIAACAYFTWAKAEKRREFLRVRRNAAGRLELFTNQSSGVLTSAVWGDGLVDNPPLTPIAPGDTVSFIPWADLWA
jgi:molybdopterin molybdotransferase